MVFFPSRALTKQSSFLTHICISGLHDILVLQRVELVLEVLGWERHAYINAPEAPCKSEGRAHMPWELQPDSGSKMDHEAGSQNCSKLEPRHAKGLPGFALSLFLLYLPDS